MADINIAGVDVDDGSPTFGQFIRVAPSDTIVDSNGDPIIDTQIYYGARSSLAGSPINWNVVDVNSGGFTGTTAIVVPSAGNYFITTSVEGDTGLSLGVTINVGASVMASLSSNEGAGGEPSVSLGVISAITTPGTQAITITGSGFTTSGASENITLQIVKLQS